MALESDVDKVGDDISLSKDNKNLDAVASLLFSQVSKEDLENYKPEELEKAADLAATSLLQYKSQKNSGNRVVNFDNEAVKRDGTAVCVLTLVNENKAFLFDSVMNAISAKGFHIYLVSHPIIEVVEQSKQGQLTFHRETMAPTTPSSLRRVSLMQFHLQALNAEQVESLNHLIMQSLEQVSVAVRDWKPMLGELQKLVKTYQTNPPQQRQDDAARVVEFLNWLADDHFTFLGMRQYDLGTKNGVTGISHSGGIELGILNDASIRVLRSSHLESVPQDALSFMESDDLLIVTKANTRSLVHRSVWLDYIGVKLFDDSGKLSGELRIVGLFTSTAYVASVFKIPYLRPKIEHIIQRLGFNMADHIGKALVNVLENYPRDDMFRADVHTLTENIRLILELGERPHIRALTHIDPFNRFVSILAFLPRTRYTTSNVDKIGDYLVDVYGGHSFECYPLFLDGALIRLSYVVQRKTSDPAPVIARAELEKNIANITHSWSDRVRILAQKRRCNADQAKLAASFPVSYCDRFDVEDALSDAAHILSLDENKSLFVVFYRQDQNENTAVSLKLFHRDKALALSQRVPLLENMGFRVIAEQTFELSDGRGHQVYMHDMQLENSFGHDVDLSNGGKLLSDAFEAIWERQADNDAFNALVQSAQLDWHQIFILRAYGRYLQQAGIHYSQDRLAQTLNSYPAISRDLYDLFCLKFDPKQADRDGRDAEDQLQQRVEAQLQDVPSLDDDLILRRFRNLIAASLRTNIFIPENDGMLRTTIAIKLNPKQVEGLPEPRPYREIFVYGPEVEGVHLRFGPVARGGIRWSDRALDYRTEVLGLVKAQQVKNAVIVPMGSKGGFYPRCLPQTKDRAVVGEAARQAYIIYISAMLSITDNLVDGKVVAPKGVMRHDGDDPYFVVAADKGTATFSDTANGISQSYNYWLDDAFASGGSAGYDHKKMAITAKGAWEAVERHFRELFARNIQTEAFTVVGVGDMSGDVFGNGMLLSKQIRLVAAFDHRDIFIDPQPEAATAYKERQRMFALERSSWQDYDTTKISKGGGVYSRSQKNITLSPEAARALGFNKKTATPFEIISAILKADVDLLWFGGIGTYIRGETENDAQVGDRANDALRITGKQVRAKIIGEGANLGLTQRARIEYSMAGGRCESDAIDNSAGVNCSDVEVNIKIALASAMQAGKLSRKQRNVILEKMAPDVSRLVLRNNYLQPLALSLAQQRGIDDLPYQMRFISELERRNLLDRKVEILPDDQALQERLSQKKSLSRPELSVVMAYAKLTLQEKLTKDPLSQDAYFHDTLLGYFPTLMQKDFADEIAGHKLHRDIVATLLANDVINRGGPTFVSRLQDKTGQSETAVVKAYIAMRDGFELDDLYKKIDALDNKISGQVQNSLYETVMTMLFSTTGWMLRHVDASIPLERSVQKVREARHIIGQKLDQLIPQYIRDLLAKKEKSYVKQGVGADLAQQLAVFEIATTMPDIALISFQAESEIIDTAKIYFCLVEMFRINKLEQASRTIPVIDYYDGMVLAQANDMIEQALRKLVTNVIQNYGNQKQPVEAWLDDHKERINDMRSRMNSLIDGDLNLSRFSVAAGMINNLL